MISTGLSIRAHDTCILGQARLREEKAAEEIKCDEGREGSVCVVEDRRVFSGFSYFWCEL